VIGKVVYSCPYVPAEWMAAHGLSPSRIIPSAVSDTSQIEGLCPYAQAFINKVTNDEDADGIIVTTLCDQMRRVYDVISEDSSVPAFLMNVPNTWKTIAAHRLYTDELKRLGRFLIRLGGRAPSKDQLADAMLAYDTSRAELMAMQGMLSSHDMARAIGDFNRGGPSALESLRQQRHKAKRGVPLAIVGGPLLAEHLEVFDIVERCGGRIVLDATETGTRGMCGRFDRRSLRDDALGELTAAYFGTIPDASNRPNSRLYRWLKERLNANGVRGIIFHRYIWCDMWHAELARMKEWASVPVLDVDIGGDSEAVSAGARQRIEAFLEMLR
jgi:benzoyl-CoA reductase/2-hydroxyglutaryl-CoA dehydratase subunit BcrC/BadD/HgdB